ncbi:putative caffeoylshikimate esterase [Iris pallida]|uniref:Caffeoylshikimate esterase n=1 Tax=Iris pallida TaxID=29817 RepID=A0AAX6EYN5_IRIPA|nr:putative caffeoylshikimate esterase [Iris pallida]
MLVFYMSRYLSNFLDPLVMMSGSRNLLKNEGACIMGIGKCCGYGRNVLRSRCVLVLFCMVGLCFLVTSDGCLWFGCLSGMETTYVGYVYFVVGLCCGWTSEEYM